MVNQNLFEAVMNGDLDRTRTLIESHVVTKADILEKDKYGLTVLRWATHGGYLEIVKFLVESGSDILEKDDGGQTLLHRASIHGNF